jgi:hypothetical protein
MLVQNVDFDTNVFGQQYFSSSGSYFIAARVTDLSIFDAILESYIVGDPNGNVQAEFLNINVTFSKSANFSFGVILTNYLPGPDVIFGNDFDDTIRSGSGNDEIYGNGGDDLVDAGPGNDFIDGGTGRDTLDYADAASGVEVNLSTGRATGGYGSDLFVNIESVYGSFFSDTLIGNSGNNFFGGFGGNDLIIGGTGADVVGYLYGIQDYTISYDSVSDSYTVADKIAGRDGTDVLSGIETLIFSDLVARPISSLVDTAAPIVTTLVPADGASNITVSSNVVVAFNETISRGSGSIQIRSGSATGAVVESFDAATSTRLTLSGNTLTIDPTINLAAGTQYFVVMPTGAIRDLAGNSYAGTRPC